MPEVSRPSTLDACLAVAFAAIGGVMYFATRLDWQYGDAPQLINRFALSVEAGELEIWMHVLYTPVAYLIESVLSGYQPILTLQLTSVLPGAVALGATFALTRMFGVSRPHAIVVTLLLMVTPAFWFFSTMIEVHALHAAAVAVCACVTLLAPWRFPVLAVTVSCVAFPLVYLSHRSGVLLGPGWVLLVQFARLRATGERFGWQGLVFGVGVGHLAALLFGMLIGNVIYAGDTGLGIGGTLEFMDDLYRGFRWSLIQDGVLYPFGFLLLMVGLGFTRLPALERWMYIAFLLPILCFFLFVFGDPTRGGYFLGVVPFLAILAGRGLDRSGKGAFSLAVLVLLAAQLVWGIRQVQFTGYEHLGAERRARAAPACEVLPKGGVVGAVDFDLQTLSGMHEGLREVSLVRALREAHATLPAETFAARLHTMRDVFGVPVAIDLGYTAAVAELEGIVAYADATFAALAKLGRNHLVEVRGRRFLVLTN